MSEPAAPAQGGMIASFARDQRGSAMTEFVMFLPVWIVVFAGLIDLAQLGQETTAARMKVQKDLWREAIEETHRGVSNSPYSSPQMALKRNAGRAGAVGVAKDALSAGGGHWGASAGMVQAAEAAGTAGQVLGFDPTQDYRPTGGASSSPGEVLRRGPGGSCARYGCDVVNDSAVERVKKYSRAKNEMTNTSVLGMGMDIAAASGVLHAAAAGMRYGSIYAQTRRPRKIDLNVGPTVEVSGGYDVLVPPSPIRKKRMHEAKTVGIARLMAEPYDEYAHMLDYNWANDPGWTGGHRNPNHRRRRPQRKKSKVDRKKCNKKGWNIPGKGQIKAGGKNRQAKAKRQGKACHKCTKSGWKAPNDQSKKTVYTNARTECNRAAACGFKPKKGVSGGAKGGFRDAKQDGFCLEGRHQNYRACKRAASTCTNCCQNCGPCTNCGGKNQRPCAGCCPCMDCKSTICEANCGKAGNGPKPGNGVPNDHPKHSPPCDSC